MGNKHVHLIMPFFRRHLKEKLIEAYRPMDILWHPIMFRNEVVKFNEPWIFPVIIPMDSAQDFGTMEIQNVKRNWFIQHSEIIDSDYYVAVDDDDMYETGVFDAIKKMDVDIVVISMKRGYRIPDKVIPDRRYPTSTLVAHPDNVQVGLISNQQSFVKGRIFKKYLYDDQGHCGDGRLAVRRKKAGEKIAYRPDLFALFNYYEPGRWEKRDGRMAFGVMVNDMDRLNFCLKQSQIDPSIPCHTINTPESACKGLNKLLDIMEGEGDEIAILVHQDMYFRQGWTDQVKEQLKKLPDSWVIAGIIGKDMQGLICGKFHDMRTPVQFDTSDIHEFPQMVCCIDECCIIMNMKKKFRFDESMDGFDLYGTLSIFQTWEMGGTAWVIDAFAEHYCMRPFTWEPSELFKKNYKWLYDRFNNLGRLDSTAIGISEEEVEKIAFMTSAI